MRPRTPAASTARSSGLTTPCAIDTVDVRVTERPVRDDREGQEAQQTCTGCQAIEAVGDVHSVRCAPNGHPGKHDPHRPRHVPARPVVAGERDRFADTGGRHQPPRDPNRDCQGDVALLLPEDAAVVRLVDLDVVVEETDARTTPGCRPKRWLPGWRTQVRAGNEQQPNRRTQTRRWPVRPSSACPACACGDRARGLPCQGSVAPCLGLRKNVMR